MTTLAVRWPGPQSRHLYPKAFGADPSAELLCRMWRVVELLHKLWNYSISSKSQT